MMTLSPAKSSVKPVTHTYHKEAAGILAHAFDQYPLMRYIFADKGSDYARTVQALFEFSLERRLVLDEPILASFNAHGLTGVAGLSIPDAKPYSAYVEELDNLFEQVAGETAMERFSQYADLTDTYRPLHSHITLSVLGVHPDRQGQGYGRMLLDAVHLLSKQHPTSTGVYLDTQVERNVALYEHAGYRLIATDRLGDVPMWFMFQPNVQM